MLWVKTFHIFFVVAWFAGLFYLPRIFVNLAIIFSNKNVHQDNKRDEYDRLIVMGKALQIYPPDNDTLNNIRSLAMDRI